MKTKYFLYGGRPTQGAYLWKGYTLPGLTRNAADTRGLSDDEVVEYLPYRASGPEPQDPGEAGPLGFFDLSGKNMLFYGAGAALAAWLIFGRKKK
jgi:hypothetical protein